MHVIIIIIVIIIIALLLFALLFTFFLRGEFFPTIFHVFHFIGIFIIFLTIVLPKTKAYFRTPHR